MRGLVRLGHAVIKGLIDDGLHALLHAVHKQAHLSLSIDHTISYHTNTSYHTIALYVLHCMPIHHAYQYTIPYLSYIADLGHQLLRSWSSWLQLLKDLQVLHIIEDWLAIDDPHL